MRVAIGAFCVFVIIGCHSSPPPLSLDSAPSCAKGEVKLVGTLDEIDQTITTAYTQGFVQASVSPSGLNFDIGARGHVTMISGLSTRGLFRPFKGTFASPITATEYCFGLDAGADADSPEADGARVFIVNTTRGPCPGTEPVSGAVAGCFTPDR